MGGRLSKGGLGQKGFEFCSCRTDRVVARNCLEAVADGEDPGTPAMNCCRNVVRYGCNVVGWNHWALKPAQQIRGRTSERRQTQYGLSQGNIVNQLAGEDK